MAETALTLHQVQRGRDAMENAKRITQVVRAHLDEPDHVPAASASGLRDKLAELEKQISKLERRFQS